MQDKEIISNREIYLICMPKRFGRNAPINQEDCKIERCPKCDRQMWVSLKKRQVRENAAINKKNNVNIWCAICIAKLQKKSIPMEIKDLSEIDTNKI
jgi:hypothetical protein